MSNKKDSAQVLGEAVKQLKDDLEKVKQETYDVEASLMILQQSLVILTNFLNQYSHKQISDAEIQNLQKNISFNANVTSDSYEDAIQTLTTTLEKLKHSKQMLKSYIELIKNLSIK